MSALGIQKAMQTGRLVYTYKTGKRERVEKGTETRNRPDWREGGGYSHVYSFFKRHSYARCKSAAAVLQDTRMLKYPPTRVIVPAPFTLDDPIDSTRIDPSLYKDSARPFNVSPSGLGPLESAIST